MNQSDADACTTIVRMKIKPKQIWNGYFVGDGAADDENNQKNEDG